MMQQLKFYIKNGKLKLQLNPDLEPQSSYVASTNNNNNNNHMTIAIILAAVDSGASDHYFPAS